MAGLALVFGMAPAPAQAADDYLVTSNPAPHDELDNPPGWVTLVFKTDASAKLAKIVVQNGKGLDVTTGDIIVEGTNVTVQLMSNLPKDTFTVTYRTSDAKGKPRGGTFQFSYGPGTWTEVNDTWIGESAEPSAIASPPSAAPEPEESPSVASSAPSQEPSAEPGQPAGSGSPNALWWYVGGGALVIVAGGALALGRRRRQNRHS
jgi:methionine-rich copper-binding protein CopC